MTTRAIPEGPPKPSLTEEHSPHTTWSTHHRPTHCHLTRPREVTGLPFHLAELQLPKLLTDPLTHYLRPPPRGQEGPASLPWPGGGPKGKRGGTRATAMIEHPRLSPSALSLLRNPLRGAPDPHWPTLRNSRKAGLVRQAFLMMDMALVKLFT